MKLKLSISIILALLLPVSLNLLAAHSTSLTLPAVGPFDATASPPPADTSTATPPPTNTPLPLNTITTVTCESPKTYTGAPITPCTATTSASDGWSTSVPIIYPADITDAGSVAVTAEYVGSVGGHYLSSSGSGSFTIDPAPSTVVFDCTPPFTYTGNTQTPCTAEAIGAGGLVSPPLLVGYTDNVNVGNATASASYAGDPNHNASNGSTKFQITKADAVCTIVGYDVLYNGNPQTATGSCVGVLGEPLAAPDLSKTANTNAGTYASDPWSFADTTGNYTNASGTVIDKIEQIPADCSSITGYKLTYDGSAHTATGNCTGIGGVLSGLDLTGTTHTDAKIYNDTWSFNNTNYLSQLDMPIVDEIDQATADCTVAGVTVVYDGAAHGATGHCQLSNGFGLDGGLTLGAKFTDVPGGTAYWSLTNANILNPPQNVGVDIVITQAESTVKVTCPASVTYDGTAQTPCTAQATGKAMDPVDVSASLVYGNNTNVGTATASASWGGDSNHKAAPDGSATFQITDAQPDCSTFQPYSVDYDGGPHTVTGDCFGKLGEKLAGLDLTQTTHTEAGAYNDPWTYTDHTGNYSNASGSLHDVINKIPATCTPPTPYAVPYDGSAHTATGAVCIGVGGTTLDGLSVTGTTHTPAGDYPSDPWTFTNLNYISQNGTIHDIINQATATCTINGYNGLYTATAHGASGTCTGVGGATLTGLNLGLTFINVPGGTANWAFSNLNYVSQNGSVAIVINQATPNCSTVAGYTVTYDAASHIATGACTGIGGVTQAGLNLSGTVHTTFGTYTDSWSFANNNYTSQSGTVTDKINKRGAAVNPQPASKVYGAVDPPLTATNTFMPADRPSITVTVTRAPGETVAGSPYLITATATATGALLDNYTITYNTANFTITKATPACSITPYNVPYDGAAHTVIGACLGVQGDILAGLVLPASQTLPGDWPNDAWSFTDGTGNYNNASGSVHDHIDYLTATCTVTPYNVVYDAAPHTPTYSCTGGGGGLTGTLAVTPRTNVGSYPDAWTFVSSDGIYRANGSVTDVITRAATTITINCAPGTFVYTGAAQLVCTSLTTSVTPSGALILNQTNNLVQANYINNTNVGTATVNFTYAQTANFSASTATGSFQITQAPTITTVTCPASVPYTGSAQTPCSAVATGVGGLNQTLPVTYTNNVTAGSTATASASYAGNTNYVGSSDSKTFLITNPQLNCTVTPYNHTYTGDPITATGSCITTDGVVYTNNLLSLAGTAHTNVGTYTDTWTFHDTLDTNWPDQSGTITDTITRANANCNAGFFSFYSGPYTGTAHGGAGKCLGVKGEDLSSLIKFSSIFGGSGYIDVNSGGLLNWTFNTGYINPNYNTQSGYGYVIIRAANSNTTVTCNITGWSGPYDGLPHGPSGTCTGVLIDGTPQDLTGSITYSNPSTYTNAPGGNVTWTMHNSNYSPDRTGTVSINITKLTSVVTVTCPTLPQPYTGSAQTPCTAKVTLDGVDQPLTVSYTNNTNPGTATASATYPGDASHDASSNSATFTIAKADPKCNNIKGYSLPYNGSSHTATGACLGAKGENLFGLNLSGTTHTNAGTYNNDPWTFTDSTGFYNNASGTVNDSITKINATCAVSGYNVSYNGAAHTATGACKDLAGVTLTTLNLSGTTHTNAGSWNDSWTFTSSNGNYNDASGTVSDSINKIDPACTVLGYDLKYDGSAHTATGACNGSTTGLDLNGTTHTAVGTYVDNWTFTDPLGNYNGASGTVNDSIGKNDPTCAVIGYNLKYDGSAHTATGTCNGLTTGLDLGGTSHKDVGDYTDTWTFTDSTGNYNNTSGTVSDKIVKADAQCSVSGYNVPFDNTEHTAAGTCTGVLSESLSGLDLTGTRHTNTGTYHDTWTFTDGTGDYNDITNGSVTDTIAPLTATCTVNGYDVAYNGSPHTATGTCTGPAGDISSDLNLSGTTHTDAGTYNDTWTFSDSSGNYASASGPVTDKISSIDTTCTVTGYTAAYDGSAHTATGSCNGVTAGLNLTQTSHTTVGAWTDNWTFSDPKHNYNDANGTVDDKITKADAACTVTSYSVPFDGAAHTATGACLGAQGETLSGLNLNGTTHTDVGDYTSDAWTFTDSTGNYNNTGGTVPDKIAKADALCSVKGYTVPHDGNSHTATGACTGVGGVALSGLDLSGTTHTNYGTYNDTWNFTDSTGNYNNASGPVQDIINKIDANCTVTAYNATYDGNAHTAAGACLGAKGETLSGLNLSGTTHTNVGVYASDAWTFTDSSGNYNNTSGTVSDSIAKANANCTVTGYTVNYDGSSHTATGTCNGGTTGLDLSGTSHTDAGSYSDTWNFIDSTGNYSNTSGPVTDNITRIAASCNVTAYNATYDGNAHTATGVCTGFGGVTLTGLNLSGTTHTAAGDYPGDPWNFTNTNYNTINASVHDNIARATPTCTVTGYTVTFDSNTHTATGACLGVQGETLAGLSLGATTHTNPGDFPNDAWTFTDNVTGNYQGTNGTVHDSIARADPLCTVTPYSVTYDGVAHTATGSCTGAGGVAISGLVLTGTTHTNAGDYPNDPWTFTNVSGNYNTITGTVHDSISRFGQVTCTVTPYTVAYDGAPHTATGYCLGLGGVNVPGINLTGTAHTNAGDYPNDAWTFTDPSGDYGNTTGTVHDSITKVSVTCTVRPYTVLYDGNAHTATGACTGLGGAALTGLNLSGTTHTDVGDYPTDAWTFTDAVGNYSAATGTVHDAITQNEVTCSVTPYSLTYDNSPHTATGTCTGLNGAAVTGLDLSSTTHTDAGDYPNDAWTFTRTGFNTVNGTVHDIINPTTASCSVTGYTGAYDGAQHGASGSCTIANGVKLSGLTLGDTFTNVPGGTAYWNFANPNVAPSQNGNVAITINLAKPQLVLNCPAKMTYTGYALTPCTAKVTGAGGLSQDLGVSYSHNTALGEASASASYLGDANHTSASASTTFTITTDIVPTPTSAALASVPSAAAEGGPVAANHKGEIGLGLDLKGVVLAELLTNDKPTLTVQPTATKAVVNSAIGGKVQSQNTGKSNNFWATYSGLFGCIGMVFLAMLIFFMFKRRRDDEEEKNAEKSG